MSTVNDVIFLSWGGQSSESVASVLQTILQGHFPSAQVFFSRRSIAVGEDPLKRMFDEGLLEANALVAVLTKDSASRPWVVWETATVWAKGRLVVPMFVDVSPGGVPGPLAVKVQGVRISERDEVDRAVNRIAREIGLPENQSLTDEEWRRLMESVAAASAYVPVPSSLPRIPAEFIQQSLPLHDGLQAGTLLAIEVRAQGELDQGNVVMTSIDGPKGMATIPVPARLFWHPGRQISAAIAQGASNNISIARVGPMPPGAVIDSPDSELPWSLLNGEWRVELQLTVRGYSAKLITAIFNVRPRSGIPNQSIEWMELVVV